MDLWIFGAGGKLMSVQCKNCRNLEVFNGEKNQYICNGTFKAYVNINKQRECMYFIKKVKKNE